MKLQIVWTPQAVNGLDLVMEYLNLNWTSKETEQLESNITRLLNQISKYPTISPKTELHKNLFKALVDKNNYIIYRLNIEKERIEIINFRGTKQKPMY